MLSPFPSILSFCQQVFLVSSLKGYHNNMFKFSSTYPSTLHIVVHTLQIIHYKFFFCCFLELPIKKTQQIFIQEYNNKYVLMCYSQSNSQSVYLSFCPCLCLYVIHKRGSDSWGYPNTEKKVEKTTCSGVFLMKFEVFG